MTTVQLAVHGRYLVSFDLGDVVRSQIVSAVKDGEREVLIDAWRM